MPPIALCEDITRVAVCVQTSIKVQCEYSYYNSATDRAV